MSYLGAFGNGSVDKQGVLWIGQALWKRDNSGLDLILLYFKESGACARNMVGKKKR